MSTKTASVQLDGSSLRFTGEGGSGHRLVLDDAAGDTGFRPAELIPLALAGCTAMDVISILRKKRQEVSGYAVHATGEQLEGYPHAFIRIDVMHELTGPGLDLAAVSRAIELSARSYCAVGATLSSGITEVCHRYRVRDTASGAEHEAEVLVAGPSLLPASHPAAATASAGTV